MGTKTEDRPPDILYRYLSWGNEHHRRLLEEREVYFAAPRDFNDPFDAQIPPATEGRASQIKQLLTQELRRHIPYGRIPRKEQYRIVKDRVLEVRTEQGRRALREDAMRRMNERCGMLCMTERKDSLLMWAHYAHGHCGVCVGLDTRSFGQFIDDIFSRCGIASELRRVHYAAVPPRINLLGFDANFGSYAYEVMVTKSSDWAYEHEWRLVVALEGGQSRTWTLGPGFAEEVILGCRISPEDEAEIKTIVRQKHPQARLFKAVVSEDRFALEFREVSLDA